MIKRIDLFMPPRSAYQVLHHFTKDLAKALNSKGIDCRVLESERKNPKAFLDKIFADPPECTLSFNGLLPDPEGRFLCDLIRIPHVACLVDAPHLFLELTRSPYSIVTCVDRFGCEFLQGTGFKNVLFMPHGVDKTLFEKPLLPDSQRNYDVLLPASFIDFEAIRETWRKELSTGAFRALEEAAEMILSDPKISCEQALVQAIDRQTRVTKDFDPRKINFIIVLVELLDYITGKDRVAMVKAITDAKVHIFGTGSEGWKKSLGGDSNVVLHEPIDYEKVLDLMQHSKIVLNSCPKIKNGAHERIFAGLASGALVLTNDTLYMREHFKNDKNIVFYDHKDINEQINRYLSHPEQRHSVIEKGRAVVKDGHTWDHRAERLVEELAPILTKIRSEIGA